MNGLLLLNVIMLATSYMNAAGIFRIPFNKVCKLYKGIQLPDNVETNKKGVIIEIPVVDYEEEDWESGEVPWDLDKNVTSTPKKTEKNYKKLPIYNVAMLVM